MFERDKKIKELQYQISCLKERVEYLSNKKEVFYKTWEHNPRFLADFMSYGYISPVLTEEYTFDEVITAILNHLNISLEKEHVSTTVKVVKNKKPKDVSTQRKDA